MANKKRKTGKRGNIATTKKQPLHYSVWTIILSLAAILLALFVYVENNALVPLLIREILLSLFSVSAYLFPIVCVGLGIYVSKVKSAKKLGIKLGLSIAGCIVISVLYQLIAKGFLEYSALALYRMVGSGGIIGGFIANIFCSLIGRVPSIVIFIFLLLVIISITIKISVFSLVAGFISGLFTVRDEISEIDHSTYDTGKRAVEKIETAHNRKREKTNHLDFTIGDDEEDKPKRKGLRKKARETEEEKRAVVSENDLKSRIDEIIFKPDLPIGDDVKNINDDEDIEIGTTLEEAEALAEELASEEAGQEVHKRVSTVSEEEKSQIKGEIENSIEKNKIEYVFPSINLLKRPQSASADKRREMQETANKLMEILKNFGVEAKLLQVTQGPSVTRYEIQPSTGVKLSKITGLAEDIALNLAVPTVLVAAVPGKAAVGIEVPNTNVNTVSVRELLESVKFKDATSKLTVALGKDIGGNVVVGDIAKMPHVLIAGSTGSGKSVCINTIITSILYKASPDEVKLMMIDPKVVELGVYNGIPHLLIPVVTDPKRAAGALNWAVGEMMRRYALFAETGSRNLTGYNELMDKNGTERLPQIVIIIDELADLMMVAAKEVEDYICRLAQLARAAGIHLIIATQRPSVDVITGLIKANVPSRIAFAVSSQVDSRTILDKGGAEKLLGKGDMLYHPTGLSNALRVQGAFVSDGEIEKIINFIKGNSTPDYSDDIKEHIEKNASGDVASEESKDDGDADELLPEAINLAVELGQISTAMIQRRLKVGYARAGRIIDQMEARGIISGANGSKPREVYMNRINMTDDM